MSRYYEVSLDVIATRSLKELEALVGISPDDGSHSLGDVRGRTKRWDSSRLRVDSGVAAGERVPTHVRALLTKFPDRSLPPDVELSLTVAVFTTSPATAVVFGPEEVEAVAGRGWSMEIIAYLCSEEDADESEA